MKSKRKYCEYCKSTFSRSHYYTFGHNKGYCSQQKKGRASSINNNVIPPRIPPKATISSRPDADTVLQNGNHYSVADVLESIVDDTGMMYI